MRSTSMRLRSKFVAKEISMFASYEGKFPAKKHNAEDVRFKARPGGDCQKSVSRFFVSMCSGNVFSCIQKVRANICSLAIVEEQLTSNALLLVFCHRQNLLIIRVGFLVIYTFNSK
jgi:hypothetical protein